MGTLRNFDLEKIKKDYNINSFVETGTYKGDSLEYALSFNFNNYFSVELLEEYYKFSANRFINKNVNLFNSNSVDGLRDILKNDIGITLYWLDAHLPNFYSGEYDSNYVSNKKILIPLEEEILFLKNNKDISRDVFIIDDLRIYEGGSFTSGEWLDVRSTKIYNGVSFIYDALENTHSIEKIYQGEGYIYCLPKIKL